MQNKIVALYFSNKNHGSLLEIILKALHVNECKIFLFLTEGLIQSVYAEHEIMHQAVISNKEFTPNAVFKFFNKADFVIIDQLYSFRELYSFNTRKLKRPNLMVIHNCNTWFNPKNPKRIVDKIKHIMSQRVLRKIGYFAVAGENMFSYCTLELGINNVTLIPFRYAEFDPVTDIPAESYQLGTPIRIVVPGMITNRRNYHELLNIVSNEELKNKIHLILLGKPEGAYGQGILSKAKELNKKGYHISFWNEFISEENFEKEIREAHLLFSYFHPKYTTNNGQDEIYGVSKETGIASLMYNKAKVGILPATFNQMQTIKNQTITFQNFEELKDILLGVYNGTLNLHEKTLNAIENATTMDLNKIVHQLNVAYETQTKL